MNNRTVLIKQARDSKLLEINPSSIQLKINFCNEYTWNQYKHLRIIAENSLYDNMPRLLTNLVRELDLFDFNINVQLNIMDLKNEGQKNIAIVMQIETGKENVWMPYICFSEKQLNNLYISFEYQDECSLIDNFYKLYKLSSDEISIRIDRYKPWRFFKNEYKNIRMSKTFSKYGNIYHLEENIHLFFYKMQLNKIKLDNLDFGKAINCSYFISGKNSWLYSFTLPIKKNKKKNYFNKAVVIELECYEYNQKPMNYDIFEKDLLNLLCDHNIFDKSIVEEYFKTKNLDEMFNYLRLIDY